MYLRKSREKRSYIYSTNTVSQDLKMNHLALLIILVSAVFASTESLECGILDGRDHAELRQITKACSNNGSGQGDVSRPSDDGNNSSEDLSDSSEEQHDKNVGARNNSNARSKRASEDQRQNSTIGNRNSGERYPNSTDRCIVQCVLEKLQLTDSRGYPQHNQVSAALLKDIKQRELKDFIQDSTDECFQVVSLGDGLNSCEYSAQLVRCLAEKGRSNCEDWPTGNLSFQH